MPFPGLKTLPKEERASYLWDVFRDCEAFKAPKEQEILETFRFLRNLKDEETPYKANLRHPYAFSAAQSIKARIWPVIFSADPVCQLVDPNPDNYERNQIAEKLLTAHVNNPLRTNFAAAWDRLLNDAVWFGWSASYTYFRSRTKIIGPRFRPKTFNGEPVFEDDGRVLIEEIYRRLRTYHAPHLVHNDVWDFFLHPDGVQAFIRRDVTGYELLAQSEGANPIYDPSAVRAAIMQESRSERSRRTENFSEGSATMMDRDAMAAEVGAEPPRHSEIERARYDKDILSKPFVVMHYDNGESHGSFLVRSGGGGFRQLRWFNGVSYDGEPNWRMLTTYSSPQELYGTSLFSQHVDFLRLHSRFFQAGADAAALQVQPMFVGSQQMRNMGTQPVFGPGGIIWTPHVNRSLDEHFKRLEIGKDFWNSFQLVDQMQRGLDQAFHQGDPQRGLFAGGRKTAYETAEVSAGANAQIEVMYKRIGEQWAVPLFKKWLAMFTEHYTARDYVLMLGSKGADYIPPSTEEIISGMSYIPKGSLVNADSQMRASRWPAIAQTAMQLLPLMQIPHIREIFVRMVEDMGAEAISRLIPSEDDPRLSEYMANVQQAMASQQATGGPGGQPSPPRSPGDISGLLKEIGGGQAPPGPVNTGGNGGVARF